MVVARMTLPVQLVPFDPYGKIFVVLNFRSYRHSNPLDYASSTSCFHCS
jgi:hypothetical protein